jgi:hypothetical protein
MHPAVTFDGRLQLVQDGPLQGLVFSSKEKKVKRVCPEALALVKRLNDVHMNMLPWHELQAWRSDTDKGDWEEHRQYIAEGVDKGLVAAQEAMASPLLELDGMMAKDIDGVIICIRCGEDMTLTDINQAVDYIKQSVSEDANIIFGATIEEGMKGKVQVSVFATSNQNKEKEEDESQYTVKGYDKGDHSEIKIENFQEMIADDIELGRPHDAMLNEDNFNSFEHFARPEPKETVIKKILKLFKKKKKDDLPHYLKKK